LALGHCPWPVAQRPRPKAMKTALLHQLSKCMLCRRQVGLEIHVSGCHCLKMAVSQVFTVPNPAHGPQRWMLNDLPHTQTPGLR
jgi:hypothetical protein